ncbi:MAG: exonuclease SbcCD subunit D [Spirochaetaceae bacterium]|nr:exonuclease SbcCD subunit D [Spirochaetaceae bacterium]MCF7947689.1 exonuclease SbcCD subunit D [Spirochaetia bacterium]MCF7950516.1 exonuclease SbcCD subunit D [Spirochaetaceae bacterium]
MRLLHTSDWHLGKRLDLFSRIEEQRQVLDEISELAELHKVDAVLVSGDLFDSFNPSTEAQELFYAALKRMSGNGSRPVIAIAGNHDSADAIQAPVPLARLHGIVLIGYITSSLPEITTDSGVTISFPAPGAVRIERDGLSTLNVLASPYANERRIQDILKERGEQVKSPARPVTDSELIAGLSNLWDSTAAAAFRSEDVNVMAAHLYAIDKTRGQGEDQDQDWNQGQGQEQDPGQGQEQLQLELEEPTGAVESLAEPEDEKPILYKGGLPPVPVTAFPALSQYVALGHLHKGHFVCPKPVPVAYCGSPLAYSRSESEQQKYVYLIDLEPGAEALVKQLPLQSGLPVLRPVCESTDEAVQWLAEHQEAYVELTLQLDNYLSSEERRRIFAAHDRILSIIPEIRGAEMHEEAKVVDVSQSIDTLFAEYYAAEHQGSAPPKELTELFREVLSAAKDEK